MKNCNMVLAEEQQNYQKTDKYEYVTNGEILPSG